MVTFEKLESGNVWDISLIKEDLVIDLIFNTLQLEQIVWNMSINIKSLRNFSYFPQEYM